MSVSTAPPETHPLESRPQNVVKRLRGYRYDDPEPPAVALVTPEELTVHAPPSEQAPTVHRPPRVVSETILDEMELKVSIRSLSYEMEDDAWDGTDVWYNRAFVNSDQMQQGTAANNSIGNQIIVRRLAVRGYIYNADTETVQGLYRLAVVRDSQRSAVDMDANTILFDGTEVTSHYLPWNVGKKKRFQVIADQVFNPQKVITGPLRIPFSFNIHIDDERCRNDLGLGGWFPNYYLVSTYNDDTVHFVLPRLVYTVAVYYVDA